MISTSHGKVPMSSAPFSRANSSWTTDTASDQWCDDESPSFLGKDVLGVGNGQAAVHHGEIVQGVFRDGRDWRNALVSLPCAMYETNATFSRWKGAGITASPKWKVHASRAAQLTILHIRKAYGISIDGGHLELKSDTPVSCGFGSSTSDVVAAIRATADSVEAELEAREEARLAVAAEFASDGTMFAGPAVLFAQRDGWVVEEFAGPLPAMTVVGFSSGLGTLVNTLELAPIDYTPRERMAFGQLREKLREAILTQDPTLVGSVATESGEINQSYRPMKGFERIRSIVNQVDACGMQISHSGTLVGIVFDSNDGELTSKTDAVGGLLQAMGYRQLWQFHSSATSTRLLGLLA